MKKYVFSISLFFIAASDAMADSCSEVLVPNISTSAADSEFSSEYFRHFFSRAQNSRREGKGGGIDTPWAGVDYSKSVQEIFESEVERSASAKTSGSQTESLFTSFVSDDAINAWTACKLKDNTSVSVAAYVRNLTKDNFVLMLKFKSPGSLEGTPTITAFPDEITMQPETPNVLRNGDERRFFISRAEENDTRVIVNVETGGANAVSADILVPAPENPIEVAGRYESYTPNGTHDIILKQSGTTVTGVYSGGAKNGTKIRSGEIHGTLVGSAMIGQWTNEFQNGKRGPIVFRFQGGGFTGIYAFPSSPGDKQIDETLVWSGSLK